MSGINQTQDLSDHSVLVIGKQQEQKKISINSATEKELQTLTGIGPSMAQRIIAYRSQQPFQTIEDIMKVKGIKEKLFAKIKGRSRYEKQLAAVRMVLSASAVGTLDFHLVFSGADAGVAVVLSQPLSHTSAVCFAFAPAAGADAASAGTGNANGYRIADQGNQGRLCNCSYTGAGCHGLWAKACKF
ncbi:MAG: ComEA family DNA-binding protein [Clostridium sp.]